MNIIIDKSLQDAGSVEHYCGELVGYLQIGTDDARKVVNRFFDYYRTEGRKALIEEIARTLADYNGDPDVEREFGNKT